MLLVAPQDELIGQRLVDELGDVEHRFVRELHSSLDCVNELVRHIERYRGKRLRPMLVLVTGMAASPDGQTLNDGHRVLATVVEMVHLATLVHDDILDEAAVRRGGSTVNYLRGNETAVMLGDYLISHAYHLCSSLDTNHFSRVIARTTNVVCEGELLQLANRENWSLDETTYFDIIRRKTASLCGVCCRVAAELHGAPVEVADAVERYGEKLGLAFQIIDDLLDLTGDEETVGKTVGRDLQKGKLTLPLIHALNTGSPAQKARLRELLVAPATEEDAGRETALAVRRIIVENGSVDYGNQIAMTLVREAREALLVLPESAARQLLLEMADAVLTRRF